MMPPLAPPLTGRWNTDHVVAPDRPPHRQFRPTTDADRQMEHLIAAWLDLPLSERRRRIERLKGPR